MFFDSRDQLVSTDSTFIGVRAGSSYGTRTAWYEVVEDRLVLRDEGNHDNLGGNSVVVDFEGYTLSGLWDKLVAINSEGSGHAYDSCHACQWLVDVCDETYLPEYLTYEAPKEAEIIKAALAVYRKESGSFRQLKTAIRNARA
jgi:hypothetical protein